MFSKLKTKTMLAVATFSIASTLLVNIRTGELGHVTHEFKDYHHIDGYGNIYSVSYDNFKLENYYLFTRLNYYHGQTNHKYSLRPMKVFHTDIDGNRHEIL